MDRRHFLGALAAVMAAGMTVRASTALADNAERLNERSPRAPEADIPAEDAQEAQYYSNRGVRRRRGGYRVRRRRVIYGRRRVNYGRRRSVYVRRRNSVRRSLRRSGW